MKKVFIILLLLIMISPIFVMADSFDADGTVYSLRAGGGGASGGGGSSGGGSSSHTHHGNNLSYANDPLSRLISTVMFIIITFIGSIVFYFKVVRSAINSRKYLKLLGKKDISWKYKNIEKQVIETFYSVQESWTNMDMTPSKKYMSKNLYDSFEIKLNFMKVNHRRNILKKINLLNIKPVSVYDDKCDNKDFVWFYVKGFMVDYIINTETNEKIDGSEFPRTFVEFWEFTRKGKDRWILAKIKQKNESDTIVFQ